MFLFKTKDQTFEKFYEWKRFTKNQIGNTLKTTRTDNSLEFCNKKFADLCVSHGILHYRTVGRNPQQNFVAERMNRTIMEDKVSCLMMSLGVPKSFWGEAVNTAVYLINRSPSIAINFKTSLELWSGEPPNLSNLRVFEYAAFAYQKEGKLDPRSKEGVFISYP